MCCGLGVSLRKLELHELREGMGSPFWSGMSPASDSFLGAALLGCWHVSPGASPLVLGWGVLPSGRAGGWMSVSGAPVSTKHC